MPGNKGHMALGGRNEGNNKMEREEREGRRKVGKVRREGEILHMEGRKVRKLTPPSPTPPTLLPTPPTLLPTPPTHPQYLLNQPVSVEVFWGYTDHLLPSPHPVNDEGGTLTGGGDGVQGRKPGEDKGC